jgi:hypothetical protein
VNELAQLVSTVGFPIAMCLVIMYFWNVQFTKKMDDLNESVSQLNVAIVRLVERLGGVKDESDS